MNITGALENFNPQLEPLNKTAQNFKLNEQSNNLEQISFAPASRLNLMNQTRINARAVHTSFSNPFSTSHDITRSPSGSRSPMNYWSHKPDLNIIRKNPKGDKLKNEIEKFSVF